MPHTSRMDTNTTTATAQNTNDDRTYLMASDAGATHEHPVYCTVCGHEVPQLYKAGRRCGRTAEYHAPCKTFRNHLDLAVAAMAEVMETGFANSDVARSLANEMFQYYQDPNNRAIAMSKRESK